LHNRLHPEHGRSNQPCLLCLMVQGHMDCSAVPPIKDIFILRAYALAPVVELQEIGQIDLRLSPSRAPPFC
jgi:hypothetical protein